MSDSNFEAQRAQTFDISSSFVRILYKVEGDMSRSLAICLKVFCLSWWYPTPIEFEQKWKSYEQFTQILGSSLFYWIILTASPVNFKWVVKLGKLVILKRVTILTVMYCIVVYISNIQTVVCFKMSFSALSR